MARDSYSAWVTALNVFDNPTTVLMSLMISYSATNPNGHVSPPAECPQSSHTPCNDGHARCTHDTCRLALSYPPPLRSRCVGRRVDSGPRGLLTSLRKPLLGNVALSQLCANKALRLTYRLTEKFFWKR